MLGQPIEATLCVSHCSGRIAVDRAKISLPVNQRISQREFLSHPDHRVIECLISVRVELTHHLTHGASGLTVPFFVRVTSLVHAPEDSTMHWLETISDIGQGPADDHAHSIVDVALLHLFRDVST